MVISIISLLSSVVLSSLSGARERSRVVAARSELNNIRVAIERMQNDTGDWPGGCEPGYQESNILLYLDDPRAGLTAQPSVGEEGGYYGQYTPKDRWCEWTSEEVSKWDGPYINQDELLDPWGNPYMIDTNYLHGVYPPPDTSADPGCPKEGMNTPYTGRGAKIYSQAEWTRGRTQGRTPDNKNPSYTVQCDDVRVDLGPQKEFIIN